METLKFLVDMYFRGGFFMHLLLFVGLISIAMVIERLIYLRENRLDWDRFQFELKSALKSDDLGKAIAVSARTKGLVGRVMQECLLKVQAGETDIADATEKEILTEMTSMERSRGWLSNRAARPTLAFWLMVFTPSSSRPSPACSSPSRSRSLTSTYAKSATRFCTTSTCTSWKSATG